MRIAIAGATGLVGHHATEAARARGHEVVPLSRATGVDLVGGVGLTGSLAGVDALVDATNPSTPAADGGAAFFRTVAESLQREAVEAGVPRVVLLSIVGIDGQTEGHPAAKLAHEAAHLGGPVPTTVLRTTQFHEFAAQLRLWSGRPATLVVPDARVRTVAAATVGAALVEAAEQGRPGAASELAGPEEAELADLVRRFVARFDLGTEVEVGWAEPGRVWLPTGPVRTDGPGFEAWLGSPDAASLV